MLVLVFTPPVRTASILKACSLGLQIHSKNTSTEGGRRWLVGKDTISYPNTPLIISLGVFSGIGDDSLA